MGAARDKSHLVRTENVIRVFGRVIENSGNDPLKCVYPVLDAC